MPTINIFPRCRYTSRMNRLLSKLVLTLILTCPLSAIATEEYAMQAGRDCTACHLDRAGEGALASAGKEFAANRNPGRASQPFSNSAKIFRIAVGYLQLITAFLWFGTILYIHLVLKPAYTPAACCGTPAGWCQPFAAP